MRSDGYISRMPAVGPTAACWYCRKMREFYVLAAVLWGSRRHWRKWELLDRHDILGTRFIVHIQSMGVGVRI